MSRQTPSAVRKRMAYALHVKDMCLRALHGEQGEVFDQLRAGFRDIEGIDLDYPDDVELIEALADWSLADILATAKLDRGRPRKDDDEALKTRARDYQRAKKREGNDAATAWRLTFAWLREYFPDYADKSDKQIKRMLYR